MSYGGVESNPSHLQQTQAQVSKRQLDFFSKTNVQVQEVVGIMRGNVEKVLERDQKLSQLDDRADALQQGAR